MTAAAVDLGAAVAPAGDRVADGAADDPRRRAAGLVARLTRAEKVAQLQNHAPGIPRLGIRAYDWWNESLHGVARNGVATVFPQAIGLAATFDEDLVRRVARAIADEALAKFEAAGRRQGGSGQYQGLTFFAPNLNIARDPRWGRGQETYGEDPFLTARLGVAYVRGLQGDDPRRLRVAAVAKHFAVHSGPEATRHRFDARVDAHDLADTYLPQFQSVVQEGQVAGIMAAYNRLNGQPCVANRWLLQQVLRESWGFAGFVVGDCGAVDDLVVGHAVATDGPHAAAMALRAGTDLDCGSRYASLSRAVDAGLVTEAELDQSLIRLWTVRARLGLLGTDTPPMAPPPPGAVSHAALAREAAQKSMVLLRNTGVLPLGAGVRRIAVIGPVADDVDVLLGNYAGDPAAPVTLLAGVRAGARARGIAVDYAPGAALTGRALGGLAAAVEVARQADVVVAALGLSPRLEGEEGDTEGGDAAGDRRDLRLPAVQIALLSALLRTGKPTVVVLTGGGAIALPDGQPSPGAVLMAWYPGEQGGHALADILFGDVSPSGRLPVTFYRTVDDLPPFGDYRMAGRTYRYFGGHTQYPFGHGLGYAPVRYRDLTVGVAPPAPPGTGEQVVRVHVTLENGGPREVEEVVQVYAAARSRLAGDPLRALVGFRRVAVTAGQTRAVDLDIPRRSFSRVDAQGNRPVVAGTWEVTVGDTATVVDLPPP